MGLEQDLSCHIYTNVSIVSTPSKDSHSQIYTNVGQVLTASKNVEPYIYTFVELSADRFIRINTTIIDRAYCGSMFATRGYFGDVRLW